jgi:uncharacterized protein YpmB
MKKKDIITLIIASVIIIASIVLGMKLLNPAPKNTQQNTEAQSIKTISGEIDENTLKKIESLSDYGKPNLDNIGKTDLFANY